MKKILAIILFGYVFAASPFFDSSVYVAGSRANFRKAPSIKAEVAFVGEQNRAFKHITTVEEEEREWHKVEYFDPGEYDVYYKLRTKWSINPKNFSRMVDVYEKPDITSKRLSFLPTNRNYKYDNKKAEKAEWVRIRIYRQLEAYVAAEVVREVSRPYFLAELALAAIARYKYWDYRTRQNVLNGEIFRYMTPAMVRAVKGEPDNVFKDKSGVDRYYSWFYGSQAINFRNHRVTSW